MYKADIDLPEELRIPQPSGFRILVAVPEIEDKSKGGVFLPDQLKALEQTASIFGFVMKLGPDAYKDETKFPTGPWCKEGDFVLFRSYSGTRFKIDKHEFRLINDDTVEAVVDDPRIVARA